MLLPRDEKERADISASLRRLLGLYLDLTAVHLGVRPGGGGVVPEYFRTKMSSILDAMEACVSDDETPFDRSERAASPGGRVLVPLTGDGPAAQHGRSSSARVWSAPAVELEGLPFVRRLVGLAPGTDGTAGLVGVLPGRLVLGTVATLEVMLGVHGANTRQPRARYAY